MSVITSLGRTLAVVGVASWLLGSRLGWDELLILAGACLVALLLAVASTIGRLGVDIALDLPSTRVEAGDPEGAVAELRVTNRRGRPIGRTHIDLPFGAGPPMAIDVPPLGAGGTDVQTLGFPTPRRAVIPIGPARAVKGDALGIARREVLSGARVDLYVHPRTMVLPAFSSGWIRDLEGSTTNDRSDADVAFHTLRDYVAGDDPRHIHWRSTAKVGTLMVRQFVETRRSHVGLVLSTDRTDWADDDEFELGVSAVGSIARTALLEDQEVTAVSGARPLPSHSTPILFDALAGLDREEGGLPLRDLVQRSLPFVAEASVVIVVVGSNVDLRVVRAACEQLSSQVAVVALRPRTDAPVRRRTIGNVSMVEIGRLDDLARVVAVGGPGW